MMSSCHETTVS